MDIENLRNLVIAQAREKGIAAVPEEAVVSENIAIIHSDISGAYDAYLKKNMDGKNGFYDELGDAFYDILLLGGIFNAQFSGFCNFDLSPMSSASLEGKIIMLHRMTSNAYNNWRQGLEDNFANDLICLAQALVKFAEDYSVPLEDIFMQKVEMVKAGEQEPEA